MSSHLRVHSFEVFETPAVEQEELLQSQTCLLSGASREVVDI